MVRLALIGNRKWAARYKRIEPRIRNGQFTAIVAADSETAQKKAGSTGAKIRTSDLEGLLSKHGGTFDAVVVRSPVSLRKRNCQLVAAAGKHVLVESPLAISQDAVVQIVSACSDAGVVLMAAQEARFSPSLCTVKESLEARQLGSPGLLRIHSWGPADNGTEEWIGDDTGRMTSGWLLSRVSREIDLACWIFDSGPSLIFAVARNLWPEKSDKSFGYVQLHLGFPGGGMAVVDDSQTLPQGDSYFSLSLIGSTGAAYADDHHNMQLLYGGGSPSALNVGEDEFCVHMQLQEFIDSIEEGREPGVTGTDALGVIEVAEAAAVSLATGEAVQLGPRETGS